MGRTLSVPTAFCALVSKFSMFFSNTIVLFACIVVIGVRVGILQEIRWRSVRMRILEKCR